MSAITGIYNYASIAAGTLKKSARKIVPALKTGLKVAAIAAASYLIARQGAEPSQTSTALRPYQPIDAQRPVQSPLLYPRTEENHLPFEYRFHRSQDYIDNVQASDLKEPVMWGIDARNRAFWSAKVVCIQKDGTRTKGVVTWFQRYTGEPRIVYGSHHMPQGCPDLGDLDPIYRSREFPDAMRKLLSGQRVQANLLQDGYAEDYSFELDRN